MPHAVKLALIFVSLESVVAIRRSASNLIEFEQTADSNRGEVVANSTTDCPKGSILQKSSGWFGEKQCKTLTCQSISSLLLNAAEPLMSSSMELQERGGFDLGKYGKLYQTTAPVLADVLDMSECDGLPSDGSSCNIKCRSPKYVPRDSAVASVVLRCGGPALDLPLADLSNLCVVLVKSTPPVKIAPGLVAGVRRPYRCDGNCIDSYFGIPYAAPPIGSKRFRPPQPFEGTWSDVRQLPDGPETACVGWTGTVGTLTGGADPTFKPTHSNLEDCLYLDVYVPRDFFPGETLPVMFWIFGGGFTAGSAYGDGNQDGAGLAKVSRAIVVSPNFRIGLLGQMALKTLKDSDPQKTTGNYGLQDQAAAMRWVKENIHAFGGDPARMYIFGISSGAFSVNYHRVAPKSLGLYSASGAHSAAETTDWWYQPLGEADKFYSVLSSMAGCPTEDKEPSAVRSCLTNLSFTELFEATRKNKEITPFGGQYGFLESVIEHVLDPARKGGVNNFSKADLHLLGKRIPMKSNPGFPMLPAGPCIDGSEEGLPASPSEILQAGKFSNATHVNLVAKDEGSMFVPMIAMNYPYAELSYPMTLDGLEKMLEWLFPGQSSAIMTMYKNDNADTMFTDIITDGLFRCSNRESSSYFAQRGKTYLIEWHAMFSGMLRMAMGTIHAETTGHIWWGSCPHGEWPTEGAWDENQEQQQLAIWLNCWSARLAHCADPNTCPESPEIPACVFADKLKQFPRLRSFSSAADETLTTHSEHGYFEAGWSNATYMKYSAVQRQRCGFWDKQMFPFVNNFYNAGS